MLILLVFSVAIIIFIITINSNSYWKIRKVKFIKPWPIIGNMGPFTFGKFSLAQLVEYFYNSYPDERYVGIYQFTKPTLIITDVDLLKQLAIKDFDHFVDRRKFVSDKIDPMFGKNLFSLTGEKWRSMRSTLSPAFTGRKMRLMFSLMTEMSDQMMNHLSKKVSSGNVVTFEMKDLFLRVANDMIATTAFGIKCDSLENRNNEFYIMGQRTLFDGFIDNIKLFGYILSTSIMELFSVKLFDSESSAFFKNIVLSTIKFREDNSVIRPDMIHLLMEARKEHLRQKDKSSDSENNDFSDDDIVAQALFFFFAGFETTSTLLCHMAHELAINPDIQSVLQNEIDDMIEKTNNKITYETLLEMKYMDMVVSETLRKWPVTPVVDRKCVKPYIIEPKNAGEKPLHIKKDDFIWFPVYAFHRDPKYFPDPEKFNPERFSDENKQNIKQFSYIPFGIGPRNCIGARLALMEAKLIFFHLLSKFDITVVKKTQIPLKHEMHQFNLHGEKGYWVGLKHRSK